MAQYLLLTGTRLKIIKKTKHHDKSVHLYVEIINNKIYSREENELKCKNDNTVCTLPPP